jgi:hypothetical protein
MLSGCYFFLLPSLTLKNKEKFPVKDKGGWGFFYRHRKKKKKKVVSSDKVKIIWEDEHGEKVTTLLFNIVFSNIFLFKIIFF